MSFGRAFRPVTPTHTHALGSSRNGSPQHKRQQHQHEEEEKQEMAPMNHAAQDDALREAQQRAALSGALFGSARPARSKFSIDTSPAALALLAAAREAATKRSLGNGGGAALDRRYAATHAQPFHSLRPSRPASWETPLADPALSLRRLALAGVERPDLARENAAHVAALDEEERERSARKAQEKFLFREAQLGVLHERKRTRVLLEQRASLRPVQPQPQPQAAALDADSNGASTVQQQQLPQAVCVRAVDEAQFDPVEVPPASQAPWDAAHHLARELERARWVTPADLAARAVSHIEAKASVEAETQRRQRAARAARVRAVRVGDDAMRLSNQARDALISSAFAHVDRVPQNLEAHRAYLASPRCGPRPAQARPTNAETCRLLPPHRHQKEAHIGRAGWTSIRTHRHYPPGSRSSGANTQRSVSNACTYASSNGSGSDGGSTPFDGITTSRGGGSGHCSGMSSYRPRHADAVHSFPDSLDSSPAVSPRRSSAPGVWTSGRGGRGSSTATTAATASGLLQAQSDQFRASFAAAVAREEAHQAASAAAAAGAVAAASTEDEEAGMESQDHSEEEREEDMEEDEAFMSARASRRSGRSGGRSVGSRAHHFPPGLELAVSPRSNQRLGLLLRPAAPPRASPRVEHLARPLARLQHVKELDRSHRDFRGLLAQLRPPPEVVAQRLQAEQTEKQWRTLVAPSPRPVSALSERPSTARSRFVRESRLVSPPSDEAMMSARQAAAHTAHPPASLSSRANHAHSRSAAAARAGAVASNSEGSDTPRVDGPPLARTPVQSPLCDHDPRPMWSRPNRLQHCVGDLPAQP